MEKVGQNMTTFSYILYFKMDLVKTNCPWNVSSGSSRKRHLLLPYGDMRVTLN